MKNNYLLSGLWLVATLGGIGYLGVTRTIASKADAQAAEQAKVKQEMHMAVQAGNAGRFAEAARMLEALQKRHPRSTTIALNLGIAYSALEHYDRAEEQFDKVLSLDPEDWDAVAEQATLKVVQGDEKAGMDLLDKIPKGQGRLDRRLMADPVWIGAKDKERLAKLREKHGAGAGDTAERRLREMERRRKEFEAANKPATKPTLPDANSKTP